MIFTISRASSGTWYNDAIHTEKPCEKAYSDNIVMLSTKDIERFIIHFNNSHYKDEYIERLVKDYDDEKKEYSAEWKIDINSLEELYELILEVDNRIILDTNHIEIYDDLIE